VDAGTERSFYLDVVDWVENSGFVTDPGDVSELMDVLTVHLFAVELTQERYDYFLFTVLLDDLPADLNQARTMWQSEWNNYTGGGDDSTVRFMLENLISSLIETPEFQLY